VAFWSNLKAVSSSESKLTQAIGPSVSALGKVDSARSLPFQLCRFIPHYLPDQFIVVQGQSAAKRKAMLGMTPSHIVDFAEPGALSDLMMVDLLTSGLPSTLIKPWAHARRGFGQEILATALRVTPRTFQRWLDQPEQTLSPSQSEGFAYFEHVFQRARAVLGNSEEAHDWLNRSAMALDGKKPMDLMGTSIGAQLVLDQLSRIEYGVLA
jgi:putative toxin-antitoxin system antitoxin component (TIGR02293 family)